MNPLAPFRFACDQSPASGVIVGRVGPCTIVRGTGADEGSWFARGKGQTRRFNSRDEAMDWARANGKDSANEHMRRFKTQDCAQDAKLSDLSDDLLEMLWETQKRIFGASSKEAEEVMMELVKRKRAKKAQDKLPDFVRYAARQALHK